MAEMSFAEFEVDWQDYANAHPDERLGQALFNYLYLVDSALSRMLFDSDFDPFYDDQSIPDALAFLKEHWDD